VILAAASGGSGQYSPTYPGGILVAWLVCNRAKRNPIGGCLLFFFWQLYGGLILTAAFFEVNLQSYIPENFENSSKYLLFLSTVLPDILCYFALVTVGTMLLVVRTWDLLKLVRWLLIAGICAKVAGLVLDAIYSPDPNELNTLVYLAVATDSLWLAYLFRSARVKHVFQTHDWETAVNYIYPAKVKVAT
jgi:hypothetical protein